MNAVIVGVVTCVISGVWLRYAVNATRRDGQPLVTFDTTYGLLVPILVLFLGVGFLCIIGGAISLVI